jgi:hypothetical protein
MALCVSLIETGVGGKAVAWAKTSFRTTLVTQRKWFYIDANQCQLSSIGVIGFA